MTKRGEKLGKEGERQSRHGTHFKRVCLLFTSISFLNCLSAVRRVDMNQMTVKMKVKMTDNNLAHRFLFFYNESQNNSSKSQSYKGEREEILQT